MKKFIFAVFIFIACFALCGCKSQEVKAAEDQIDSIGEITTESGLAISEAEETYAALSADKQKDVENYQILIDARSAYQGIVQDSFQSAIEAGNYEEGDRIAGELDDTTLRNIGYTLIACGTSQAFNDWWDYENNDKYISDEAIERISGIVNCARNIGTRLDISEDDEFYPVIDFLKEFQDYTDNEIQYFNLAILHNKTSDLVDAVSDFIAALNSGSKTRLYSGFYKIESAKQKIDYSGDDKFATQYIISVDKIYNGASTTIKGIETNSSDAWENGLAEMQEGIAAQTDLSQMVLENLEQAAVLLSKSDTIDSTLKEWTPTP